jgi:hypothetical protein
VNSLLILGVYMSVPEKLIFLDFRITIAKYLETIRADVEGTKLAVQAVGHQRGVFEKAVVAVDTIFHPSSSIEIGSAVEVGSYEWWGSHQAFLNSGLL